MIFKTVALVGGLGTSVIISRILGPEGRGIYGLLMTVIVLSASFGVFGFGTANTYFIARDRNRAKALGIQSIIVGLAGSIISGMAFYLFYTYQPRMVSGIDGVLFGVTLLMLPLFLWGNLFSQAFLGLGKIIAYNIFNTGQRLIFVGAALLMLIVLDYDIGTYMISVLVGIALLMGLYIHWYIRVSPKSESPDIKLASKSFFYGSRPYIATIFAMATLRSGIFFVNYFRGTSEAGLFAVAQQISELLVIVPSVVGGILFPRVANGDSKDLTAKVLRTMNVLILPLFITLALGAKPIITFLFGPEFLPSAGALLIILPGAFLLGLQVIIAGDIAGRGYPWPAALVWIPVFILNCTGYILLVPRYGINGAALSLSLSFMLVSIYMISYLKKLTGFRLIELLFPRKGDFVTIFSTMRTLLPGRKRRGGTTEGYPVSTPGQKEYTIHE